MTTAERGAIFFVMSRHMADEYPEKIKLYDHVSNSGIVHLPGRRFPAVAIQGDSLSGMLTTAVSFMAKARKLQDEDLYYAALMLAERLQGHLCQYEDALEKEGFGRPYAFSAKELQITDDFDDS